MKMPKRRHVLFAVAVAALLAAFAVPSLSVGASQGGTLKMIAWDGYLDAKWVSPF
jgi:spermidine/putrescine-binding protein